MVGKRRVVEVDTQEVVALLEHGEDSVVLVDVRSEPEIAVSMLPGAITMAEFEQNRKKFAGRTVVPYCTVGGRSLIYSWKLAAQGIDARNYRGSLLGWCAAARPLVTREGVETKKVHTYSRLFFKVPQGYERG